jgi:hypothetical protein
MTKTKSFHSAMPGAPVLSGTAGALISLLDAVLVNGFGLQSVSALAVAGGVATATVPATPAAGVDAVILVTGATPSSLNGEHRVTAVGANTVSWVTTAANGAATGSAITLKVAPLDWLKALAGAGVAAYQSADPLSSGMLVRVDDTGAKNARVVGYEAMSDINTGVKPFPIGAQAAGGYYWPKSRTADATARPWYAFGDSRGFYLCVNPGSVSAHSVILFFGDLNCSKSGDAYGAVLHGMPADYTDYTAQVPQCLGYSAKGGGHGVVARASNALGGSQLTLHVGTMHISNGDSYSGYGAYSLLEYPNKADNGLLFCKVAEIDGAGLRGTLPGLYHVPQGKACDAFSPLAVELATGEDIGGRAMMALRPGAPSSAAVGNYGVVFFDLTGPWR